MDAVRGTAILLLLIWHASAIPELFGIEMPAVIRSLNSALLPYRMPTLMILSGMLLSRSMRKPVAQYYAGKLAMILWPYLIWVLIAKAIFLDVDGMPWWHWRAWYATTYLWFLFFIGVYYLAAPLFARLPAWAPVLIASAAGLVLPYGTTEQRMAYFAVFFFAGNWLAQDNSLLRRLTTWRWSMATVVPVIAFSIATAIWTDAIQFSVLGAPVSVAGVLLMISLYANHGGEGRVRKALSSLGRSSLVLYVSHFPIMVIVFTVFVGAHPLLLAAMNLVAAVALGCVLSALSERAPMSWLFRAPRPLTRASAEALQVVFRDRVARPCPAARPES